MTQLERDILRGARRRIASGERHYICPALLAEVYYRNSDAAIAANRLVNYIEILLDGYSTLDWWQESNGIWHDERQKRHDRLCWIDWMLGELE